MHEMQFQVNKTFKLKTSNGYFKLYFNSKN